MIRRFFKDSIIYGLSTVAGRALSFLVIPIYTNIFSVENYGTIGVIASIVGFAGIFMQCGTGNAMTRFYFDSNKQEHKNSVLISGLFILFCSSTITIVFSYILSIYFSTTLETYEVPVVLILIALVTQYFSQFAQYAKEIMRVFFAPIKYFLLDFFPGVFTVVATLVFLFFIEKTLTMFYTGAFVGAIIGLFVAFALTRRSFVFNINRQTTREMFDYGYPFILVGLAYWIFQTSDRLMLLWLSDKTEVGLYYIGSQVASILLIVIGAFAASWSPYAMKMLNENINHRELFSIIATMWLIVLSSATIFMILFAGEILTVITPNDYHGAQVVIPALVFSNFMLGTTQITVIGISIVKKTKLISKYSWIMAILNIALNLLLIPMIGVLGAAISTALSNTLLTSFYLYTSQKEYYIAYQFGICSSIILFIFILSVVFSMFITIGMLNKIILFVIFIALACILFYNKSKEFKDIYD